MRWLLAILLCSSIAQADTLVLEGGSIEYCSDYEANPTTKYCNQSATYLQPRAQPGFRWYEWFRPNWPAGEYTAVNFKIRKAVGNESSSTYCGVHLVKDTAPWTTSADWNTYDGTNAWTTGGYHPFYVNTTQVAQRIGTWVLDTWYTFTWDAIGIQAAEDMANGVRDNNGFMLRCAELGWNYFYGPGDSSGNQPEVNITYTPAPVTFNISTGQVHPE